MNNPKIPFLKKISKKQFVEMAKNVAIVVLLVSALLLAGEVGIFSGAAAKPQTTSRPAAYVEGAYVAAATPFLIVVTPESGSHTAIAYDEDELSEAYKRFSSTLGQALGSSSEPEQVTQQEWENALSGRGVYFDFYSGQPLDAVARWLDTSISGKAGDNVARRICLALEGDSVVLYYTRTRDTGGVYRCKTAVNASQLSEISEYIPNGAYYNFEYRNPFEGVDRCAILTANEIAVPGVTVRLPGSGAEAYAELMDIFNINSFTEPYVEKDGTVVYVDVDGEATLQITPSGKVTYTRASAGSGNKRTTTLDAIEDTRRLCSETMGRYGGDAEFYMSYILRDSGTGEEAEAYAEPQSYTVRYDYRLAGLPVFMSDGQSAAEFVIRNGELIYASIQLREYTVTDEWEHPLPSLQAAAIVRASGGGEPVLCYVDDASNVAANWRIR